MFKVIFLIMIRLYFLDGSGYGVWCKLWLMNFYFIFLFGLIVLVVMFVFLGVRGVILMFVNDMLVCFLFLKY